VVVGAVVVVVGAAFRGASTSAPQPSAMRPIARTA